ncbi:MAG: carbohydrate ABC transporter permease [Bacteroidota bacterium]
MNKRVLAKVALYAFLALSVVLAGFPLLYAIIGSFKTTVEFLTSGASLFPKRWMWQNYADAWRLANFSRFTVNSLGYALWTIAGALITSTLTGYVLSRANFAGKRLLIAAFIATLFVSGALTLFPIYKLCLDLGLTNSILGLSLAEIGVSQPLFCLLTMGYINGISREIDESAKIDGCSFFRIYWNIILPIIRPMLATIVILQFRRAWNDFMMPLAFTMSKPELRPLTVGIVMMKDQGEGISAWNLMIPGTVISLVPMIVVYLVMNKFFIKGITEGALKG